MGKYEGGLFATMGLKVKWLQRRATGLICELANQELINWI